jgi:hypothetical protein
VIFGEEAQRARTQGRQQVVSFAHRSAWWALAVGAALGLLAGTASSGGAPYGGSRVPLPARYRGIFPGLHYTYRGGARLRYSSPPASAALPGANDLVAAGPAALIVCPLALLVQGTAKLRVNSQTLRNPRCRPCHRSSSRSGAKK